MSKASFIVRRSIKAVLISISSIIVLLLICTFTHIYSVVSLQFVPEVESWQSDGSDGIYFTTRVYLINDERYVRETSYVYLKGRARLKLVAKDRESECRIYAITSEDEGQRYSIRMDYSNNTAPDGVIYRREDLPAIELSTFGITTIRVNDDTIIDDSKLISEINRLSVVDSVLLGYQTIEDAFYAHSAQNKCLWLYLESEKHPDMYIACTYYAFADGRRFLCAGGSTFYSDPDTLEVLPFLDGYLYLYEEVGE
ncbi:MAG: hypothetical protein LBG97_03860 [Coriobacteriales bacterium]|jgi:hypothetical protein|nr:hypothetical protein [Coriobacteriales bacterium]